MIRVCFVEKLLLFTGKNGKKVPHIHQKGCAELVNMINLTKYIDIL